MPLLDELSYNISYKYEYIEMFFSKIEQFISSSILYLIRVIRS